MNDYKKIRRLIGLAILSLPMLTSAQQGVTTNERSEVLSAMKNGAKPYAEVVKDAEAYLEKHPEDRSVAKKFGRWNMFWRDHLKDGYCYMPYKTSLQRTDNSKSAALQCTNQYPHDWVNLSVSNTPAPIPGTFNGQNSGRIESVYAPLGQAMYNGSDRPRIIYAGAESGGLWRSLDAGITWTNVTDVLDLPAGGVRRIIGVPENDLPANKDDHTKQTIYICFGIQGPYQHSAGNGVYVSHNGGDTWARTSISIDHPDTWIGTQNYDVFKDIVVHPDSAEIMYAAGQHIYGTTDGFLYNADPQLDNTDRILDRNWSTTHTVLSCPFTSTASTPVVSAVGGGWSTNFLDLELVPGSNPGQDDILFATTRFVGTLTDPVPTATLIRGEKVGGVWQWTDVSPRPTPVVAGQPTVDIYNTLYIQKVANPAAQGGYDLYCAINGEINGNGPSPMFKSSTLGNSWTFVAYHGGDVGNKELFIVNPNNYLNSPAMYFGGTGLRKKAGNGGYTTYGPSEAAGFHDDMRDLWIYEASQDGSADHVLIGTDGGVTYSEDGGASWTDLGSWNLPITQYFGSDNSSSHPGLIVGGAQDNGYFQLADGTWRQERVGDGGQSMINERHETNPIIYLKNNGGVSRTQVGSPISSGLGLPGPAADHFTDIVLESDPNWDNLFVARNQNIWFWNQTPSQGVTKDLNVNLNLNDEKVRAASFATPTAANLQAGIDQILYVAFTNNDIWKFVHDNNSTVNGGWSSIKIFENNGSYFRTEWPSGGFTNYNNLGVPIPATTVDGEVLASELHNFTGIISLTADPENPNRFWVGLNNYQHEQIWLYDGDNEEWTMVDGQGTSPDFPIHDIEYQYGTGALWAATDKGVYRYDPVADLWECYNLGTTTNLPVCIVQDINIDYCKRKILISTFGRGVWETELPEDGQDEWTINNNTTWNERNIINSASTIRVKSGNRLTVKGILNMASESYILIEPGAELVVDGGIITNRCGDMWRGIQVWGDKNSPQTGTFPNHPQGKLILKNGAIIEHAVNGALISYDWQTGIDNNKNGGIIQAENSTFRNNNRDVAFHQYVWESPLPWLLMYFENESYFKEVNFEINSDYRSNSQLGMVTMWDVHGVDFYGCTFKDTRSSINSTNLNTLGKTGIYSVGANFKVTSYCTNPTIDPYGNTICNPTIKSEFDNLRYGVEAINNSQYGNFRLTVENSDFDCFRGVHLNSISSSTLINNTISTNYTVSGSDYPYGMHIELSNNYWVEGNELTSTSGNINMGITVRNDHGLNERIYRNSVDGYFLGISALDLNHGDPANGLTFQCNQLSNNQYDIVAYDEPTYGQSSVGVNDLQAGVGTSATGNTFNNAAAVNILNQGQQFEYYYGAAPLENPTTAGAVVKQFTATGAECTDNTISSPVYKSSKPLEEALASFDASDLASVNKVVLELNRLNTPVSELLKVNYLTRANQMEKAEMVLNTLPEKFDLNQWEQEVYNDYMELTTLLNDWDKSDVNLSELSTVELQMLQELLDRPNIATGKAMELLALNNALSYTEPLQFPSVVTGVEEENQLLNSLLVYPNPSEGQFTVQYQFQDHSELTFELIDGVGRQLHVQSLMHNTGRLDYTNTQLENGTYYCIIKDANGQVLVSKAIVLLK